MVNGKYDVLDADHEGMRLPEGKHCSDCKNVDRCVSWYGVGEEDIICVCHRSAFVEKELLASPALLSALKGLTEKWEKEGSFLDNPHDSKIDRQAGRIYKNCARELRKFLV